jgi:hypothetical protein
MMGHSGQNGKNGWPITAAAWRRHGSLAMVACRGSKTPPDHMS